MRKDMGKVITERPRHGLRMKHPKGSKKEFHGTDWDDQPKSEKISLKWRKGFEGKEFSDVLGPLRGYVLSVIGRPFDKVYSEISKVLRPAGLSGSHAQDHLWQMLVRDVVIDDEGFPCRADLSYGHKTGRLDPSKYREIAYVDPRDGIIKRVKESKKRRRKDQPIIRVVVDSDHQCHRIDDLWYMIEVEPVVFKYEKKKLELSHSKSVLYFDRFVGYSDLLMGWVTEPYKVVEFYGGKFKAVSKRQMNKREIKKYISKGVS